MSPSTSTKQFQTEQQHSKEVATILRLLLCFNFFFAPVKDGLAPLVSVFLVVDKGWDAGSAGIVWFARDISSLICQTFAGAIIDSSEHKRLLLSLATVAASIASMSMIFTQNFYIMIVKSVVEGVAISFIQPCKVSIVLGLVCQDTFDSISKANEMADHTGSFVFIVLAGALAYGLYPDVVGLFYVVGGAGLIAFISLILMPLSIKDEDDKDELDESTCPGLVKSRSRINHRSSRNLTEGGEVKSYSSILWDKNIAIFAVSVFFFHFGNAGILPLLSQVLALDSGRAGLPYTCANVAVAQLTSILATWVMGRALEAGVAYKIPLAFGYAFGVPVRCIFIVVLLKYWPNNYALLATQLFDGIGAGVFGLSMSTLTRALTVGTGRFSFTIGVVSTVGMTGGALSNLVGGFVVNLTSYELAFNIFGIVGIFSVVLGMFIHIQDQEGKSVTNSGSNTNIAMIDSKEPGSDIGVGSNSGSNRV